MRAHIDRRRVRRLVSLVVVAATIVAAEALRAQPWSVAPGGGAVPDAERLFDDHDARTAEDAPSSAPLAAQLAAGDYRIDALLSGYTVPSLTVTYSFYEDSVFGGTYYGLETGVREVSQGVKDNVRAIMATLGTMVSINFVEVTESASSVGYIRFMLSDNPNYAYAYYPTSSATFHVSGDVHLNPSYDRTGDTNGFQNAPGEHGYTTLIHEIGHALGLKHPHDSAPNLPAGEDNHSHTVMSYGFPGQSPGTPMPYDLMALHHLYGATDFRWGNDTYVFERGGLDQYSVGGMVFLSPSYETKQTIWDSGGVNVVDLSTVPASASGYRLDLNPLGWLTTNAAYKGTYVDVGTSLGPGVAVQRLINSGSSDTVYANASANVFAGYAPGRTTGADVIYGATAADLVDLSAYRQDQVTRTTSGSDLVLGLGAAGSITLKDYALGYQPSIVYEAGSSNQAPIASASASPPSGPAPLTVAFSSSGSNDPDGTIVGHAWTFGDGEASTEPNPVYTYQASGTFTATLTVTDNGGATDTRSISIVVSGTPAPSPVLYVSAIALKLITKNGLPAVQATVTVKDQNGALVSGVTVSGKWSGLITQSQTKTTNANGRGIFKSKTTTKQGTVTFAVTSVSGAGYQYDPARNVVTSKSITMP